MILVGWLSYRTLLGPYLGLSSMVNPNNHELLYRNGIVLSTALMFSSKSKRNQMNLETVKYLWMTNFGEVWRIKWVLETCQNHKFGHFYLWIRTFPASHGLHNQGTVWHSEPSSCGSVPTRLVSSTHGASWTKPPLLGRGYVGFCPCRYAGQWSCRGHGCWLMLCGYIWDMRSGGSPPLPPI